MYAMTDGLETELMVSQGCDCAAEFDVQPPRSSVRRAKGSLEQNLARVLDWGIRSSNSYDGGWSWAIRRYPGPV